MTDCDTVLDADVGSHGNRSMLSDVVFAQGRWTARHNGKTASFSVSKYGHKAKELAEQELKRLMHGLHNDPRKNVMDRYPVPFSVAAEMFSMSISQLRSWLLTGHVNGVTITPPIRVNGKDAISGVEVDAAVARLARAKNSMAMEGDDA